MTLTNVQKVTILHPVASCISFESMSTALSSGSITPEDIHAAAFRTRTPGPMASNAEIVRHCDRLLRRLHALARLTLAVQIQDTEGYFDGDSFEAVVEAVRVAREVLA